MIVADLYNPYNRKVGDINLVRKYLFSLFHIIRLMDLFTCSRKSSATDEI
jgi:hypothetical protein